MWRRFLWCVVVGSALLIGDLNVNPERNELICWNGSLCWEDDGAVPARMPDKDRCPSVSMLTSNVSLIANAGGKQNYVNGLPLRSQLIELISFSNRKYGRRITERCAGENRISHWIVGSLADRDLLRFNEIGNFVTGSGDNIRQGPQAEVLVRSRSWHFPGVFQRKHRTELDQVLTQHEALGAFVESVEIYPWTLIQPHNFGLLLINAPLQYSDTHKSYADKYFCQSRKPDVKEPFVAMGVAAVVFIIGSGFCWGGYGNCSAQRYIGFNIAGVLLVCASPLFAMLITHRLFWGDWWPFFGPLTSHLSMLPHTLGICV